ncbi:hypothetical protein SAMN05216167_1673 [Spirosoma endophyticum]|uniref:DNA binding domain-containing protein, excisionase family n=1 Tax=Spirosoma endophyticum TaxID=662367 RepID=A0A1I2IEC2_9BACT|nr:hypothetical protein SAMN05216167_1673 [Spirosoma endophyticum]
MHSKCGFFANVAKKFIMYYYSLQEAAIALNLRVSMVQSLIRRGKLKSSLVDGQLMLSSIDLYNFIKMNTESATHL